MPLNALTLTVTNGVVGRPFAGALGGKSTGTRLRVKEGSAPGFGVTNNVLSSLSMPYENASVTINEYQPSTGESRDTTFTLNATRAALVSTVAADGSITYTGGGSGAAPTAQTGTASASGVVYTVQRLLGSTSTLSLASGSNSNLSINNTTGAISAASAIAVGASQTANVREANNGLAVEYPVTITGVNATPAPTPTPGPSPTLNALLVSPSSATVGTAFTGTISGKTADSTLALSGAGAVGLSVSGTTISGTPTTEGAVNIVETLAGATNSPRTTNGTITIAAAGPIILNYPRIAVIGPSTDANNMYGTNSPSPARNGPAASGPLVWALAKDRRARIETFTQTASPYWAGDIKAAAGAVLSDMQAQIDAAITRKNLSPSDAWVAAYNPGRNDLQDGKLLADYQAAIPGHITSLRNAGFSYIMIALLAYKPAAYGGQWVAGGAYRQEVDKINAWINSTYGSAADIKIIDSQAALLDPSTGSAMEPYANAYRSDATHLTAQGGERASAPYVTALQAITASRAYPTNPVGLTVAPFSGAGGTLTGTGLTGTMADGWTAALETAGPTIVASQVVEGGRTWQRFTVSNTEALPANGVNLRITRNSPVAIASGVRKGMRTLFRSTASSVKYGLFFALGNSSGQGDTSVPAARATLIAGVADATTNAAIGGAGANFAGTPGFLPTAKTVAFESSSFIQGASSGSNANVDFLIIIGPGNAGDTIVFDLADPQDFNKA